MILAIFLAWLLKFLLHDLDTPAAIFAKDSQTRRYLENLQHRFRGAINFMQKTTVTRQEKVMKLNQLPWYLLIGPMNAGKTTFLANADINYILQKQFSTQQPIHVEPSEHCDWWITRDLTFIDVPGKYLGMVSGHHNDCKPSTYLEAWKFFLRLIKKQRGKNGLDGIVLTLPLPEFMKQSDTKLYPMIVNALLQRLQEFKAEFPQKTPCYLVISKCDLLSGFSEFFGETDIDEINQAWGFSLPTIKNSEKISELFTHRFNTLIKKLNEQLLWRLHQERNPLSRPYIKDFPLQVERLKEMTNELIKQLMTAAPNLSLHGVYLTSAHQPQIEPENTIIEESINSKERGLKLFKEPVATSRAYFIKQLITNALVPSQQFSKPAIRKVNWNRRLAYAVSACAIATTGLLLGKDFEQGVKQAYSIQNNLSDYRIAIQQMQDHDEHLARTLDLLNKLQPTQKDTSFKLDLSHLLSFYSHKSEEKANIVYDQALQTILLPEMTNYLGETLKNPVNKNIDYLYNNLKAYVMLGDKQHYQPVFVAGILQNILPKSFSPEAKTQLMHHIVLMLNTQWAPQTLDTSLLQYTRQYLLAMPSIELGYIILKSFDNNSDISNLNLAGNSSHDSVFVLNNTYNQIPLMFTSKEYSSIITQEATTAAVEAMNGNWILGLNTNPNRNTDTATTLIDALRNRYITNYIKLWEDIVSNIQLNHPIDLAETDALISQIIANDSPLLQLLQTLRDNTNFTPINSTSAKLQNLALLLDKNDQAGKVLYQIFANLQSLHAYLQTIISADNEKKAAFSAVSSRMQHHEANDAITQIYLIAEQSPEPVKIWLNKLANDAWHYLVQDASRYIDISWQEKVTHLYSAEIADRYPFNTEAAQEVSLERFTQFFSNDGVIPNFYNDYLTAFVDTSSQEWRWKSLDGEKLPFSDDTLHQIQQAMRINHTFFPNGSNKLNIQFALQAYKIGKEFKNVALNINDKQIVDNRSSPKIPHVLTWPSDSNNRMTSIQFTMNDAEIINREYPGEWGWFKLVNQSFESAISRKAMLINLSMNATPAKYLLYTDSQFNPFLPLNMRHFSLPQQLITEKA